MAGYCFKHEKSKVGLISDPGGPLRCLDCLAETIKPHPDKCQEDPLPLQTGQLDRKVTCPNCGTCDNPKVCQSCGYCYNCKKYHFELKAQLWPTTYVYYIPYQPIAPSPVYYPTYQPWYNTAGGGGNYIVPASSFIFNTSTSS